MIAPPGFYCDLDAQVDEALVNNTPNAPVVNTASYWESSLVATVCIDGRLDLADRLFAAGAQMDAKGFSDVLWWGCDAATAAYLLARGVPQDKDNLNSYLKTLLRQETWETIFFLLDCGADIETVFEYGARLLHVAAKVGKSTVVQQLLKRGATVDCRDNMGLTPLLKACDWKGSYTGAGTSTVYWLLNHGADPNAQTPEGETPLILCTCEKVDWFINRTKSAQMLLRFGANPNIVVPKYGVTPLMFAARDNDEILVRALLKAGADTTIQMPNGKTAYEIARLRNNKEVMALLG